MIRFGAVCYWPPLVGTADGGLQRAWLDFDGADGRGNGITYLQNGSGYYDGWLDYEPAGDGGSTWDEERIFDVIEGDPCGLSALADLREDLGLPREPREL